MLLLSRIAPVIVLTVVVQCVNGYQRVVQVSNDDKDSTCCVHRNCSCHSLDHALAHLTSNVLLNITTDVTLTSLIHTSNLGNVAIIGHNNPTVNCKGTGGIRFFLCSNCIIQGITWDKCGADNYEPVLQLTFVYNVIIQNCSFQHSSGQAIELSKVSGYLNIRYCKFVDNSLYKSEFSAIISYTFLSRSLLYELTGQYFYIFIRHSRHYQSYSAMMEDIIAKSSQLSISIHGCDFSDNRGARSLIYINNLLHKQNIDFTISSSEFYHNQGVSISIINQLLYVTGKNLFHNNIAKNGAGIHISHHSTVVFGENANVTFLQNSAHSNGSAVFSSDHSTVIFDKNSKVTFISNKATRGTVYSWASCNVIYKGACNVTFYNNSVLYGGGAVFSSHSNISFENNAYTEFNNSHLKKLGGAIYAYFTHISFKNNSTTQFSNMAGFLGGAIFAYNSQISFKDKSTTKFSNNSVDYGGILCAFRNSHIYFEDNSAIKFNNNHFDYFGTAIYVFSNSHVSFKDNSTVAFILKDNTAISAMSYAKIIFDGNCTVSFISSKSTNGVIVNLISISKNSSVIALENFNVTFNNQSAKWCTDTCLPYPGKENDDVKIDNFGIVWCNNPHRFICQSKKCQCKNFKDSIVNIANDAIVTLSDKVILSSAVNLSNLQNVSIIGKNNLAVICANGGSLQAEFSNNLTIQGIAWFGCEAALKIYYCKDVILRNCSFLYSKEQAIKISKPSGNVKVSYCKFMYNNHYSGHGSAIHYCSNNTPIDKLTIKNSEFSFNIGSKSIIYIKQSQNYIIHHHIKNSTFHNNQAICVHLVGHLNFSGNLRFRNNVAETGTGIYISNYSTVMFRENSRVKFINNTAYYFGAAIFLGSHSRVAFDKKSMVTFSDNYAINGTIYSKDSSVVLFKETCEVMFNRNKATQCGAAIYSVENSHITFADSSNITFCNNIIPANKSESQFKFGGTIFTENSGQVTFKGKSTTLFINNTADFGVGIFSVYNSSVKFRSHSRVMFYNNIAVHCGVLTSSFSSVYFNDNADVTYNANKLSCPSNSCFKPSAGAICSVQGTDIILSGHSSVTFMNNTADHGAGAIVSSESTITIQEHSTVIFNSNIAKDSSGGALACYNSNITVKGNSNVTFNGNKATQSGGGLHLYNMSKITFTDNSTSSFINNIAIINGGAVLNDQSSEITLEGNSTVHFNYNRACNGGTFYCTNSSITFKEMSVISFYHNKAKQNGGVGYFNLNSNMIFEGITNVSFNGNIAEENGGVLYAIKSDILFQNGSNLSFTDNRALDGGSISANDNSYILSTGSSVLSFISNEAIQNGGAFHVANSTNIKINEKSMITMNNNYARQNGGVIHSINSIFAFEGNSTVSVNYNKAMLNGGAMCAINSDVSFSKFANILFHKNTAVYGGAVLVNDQSNITVAGNAEMSFLNNEARDGGAVYVFNMCKIVFTQNSTSSFITNRAILHGGSVFTREYSYIKFMEQSKIAFNSNAAKTGGTFYTESALITFTNNSFVKFNNSRSSENGGVIYSSNSTILFKGNSVITFSNNIATVNGGVLYLVTNSYVSFSDNTSKTFENNSALHGGAICLSSNSNIAFKDKSTALFKNNTAYIDGGAVNIFTNSSFIVKDNTAIVFNANSAQYGGAMYFDTTHSSLVINRNMEFSNNIAKFAGKAIYFDSTRSCNRSCLYSRIIGNKSDNIIATPPSKLVLKDPAVCIDDDTKIECNEYLLHHVMLGEEINIPACLYDYFNHSTYQARFYLHDVLYQNYSIRGSIEFLLSCGSIPAISIIGNKSLTQPLNYSMNIALHNDRNLGRKPISVNLTIELTPCHPGFWQYFGSQRCECYNASDIVFCSGSTSTIKRGYWFGSIKLLKERPTVTLCPINYCNFTCCETSNGYYHLSPLRDDQCRSHRTGPACGSCTDGYTLSFDSTECVDVDNCTAGQTVLVILLTVIYWMAMFTLVFAIMYYKVGIGYLYSITYYYSIVDILLSQNMHASRGLHLTTTILSSFSKITPQFLGELCLTTGMSGIDQHFIHYLHPSAVILILILISLLARKSRRISTIISRGIIHVICLLLLLSYTSIASTSLLLMRSLKFLDIDKVYTYLSPDIEYLHGRHLAYAIVAMLCTVSIVIGLPLVLTLEPFLNHKINFIKIKPLLDQFQGCYKDKFRFFAGYYMICRLVVITIVIANSSNNFVSNYMLVISCGIIALVHLMVKPYSNEILNKFDGIILQLIIFTAILPWLDDFTSPLVITLAYILIILPLLSFTAITLFLHKDDFKKIFAKFTAKFRLFNKSNKSNKNSIEESEAPQSKFHFITDDNKRKNATICEV